MKVHEYNEMMAYLLRPKKETQVASLMDEYLGDQKEYQKAVDEGFQGTYEEYLRMKSLERKELSAGGRIEFGKAGFVSPTGGYTGYVSDERLELEKKIPQIKKLYLKGLNDTGIAEKLNTTAKRVEVILDELRGRSVTNIGGKKVKSGYNIPEDTPRGKLYKANRITKAEEKARGRGGSDKKTSPKRKEVIEAAKKDAKKLTATEIAKKYNISYPSQKKFGIKPISEREKYKDKFIKPTITKYGKNLIKVLEKNPSLITNQDELFKKAKVPINSTSSVIRALNTNPTLVSGKKRFDIPKSISKLIPKIYGPVESTEDVFREAGASPQEIRSALIRPGTALKESFIPEGSGPTKLKRQKMKGTVFEHSFPKSLVPYIKDKNIQRQLLLTGERTSPFLNSFKTRFDVLQKGAVTKFLEDGNLSAYNKKINEIRNTVRKLTGGYEIGYIKFDKNKNATPMVKAKPVSEGLKEFGTETTQKVSAFKNAKYTSNLLRNFKKDPNNINYSTLRKDINVNQVSDEVIKLSDEAAKAYEKAKPFLGFKDKFLNFAQKNLNNKLVGTLFKKPTGRIGLITGAVLLPTALMAGTPKEKGLTTAEVMAREDEGFTDTEKLLAGTTAGGAAYAARRPLLKTAAAIARPFGLPTVAGGLGLSEFVDINPFRFATEEEREAGKSFITRDEKFGSLKDDPSFALAGADLLLPELTKQVGIRSLLANPFGRLARGFTPLGIGLQGVELINQARKEQKRIDAMSPEEREDFIAEQESLLDFSA